MATSEREEQALDGAITLGADGTSKGLASPRKQQGQSRQYLGTFGKEVDAERLAHLRKENLEFRQGREKAEEKRRKKNEEMCEAWKKRKEEIARAKEEERRIQLLRLEGQKERSTTLKDNSLTFSDQEEIVDEEYRMLLEKYGDRVRVPRVPPNPWKQRSVTSTESGRNRSREEPRKPTLPRSRTRPTAIMTNLSATVGAAEGGSSSSTAQAGSGSGVDKKKAPLSARASMGGQPSPHVGAGMLPSLSPGGAATSARAPVTPARGNVAATPSHHTAGLNSGTDALSALAGDSAVDEIPEPERSLMPRKDGLRKIQQALIKKTDVSFYKSHMKKHFRKILEATEVTFSDYSSRRQQATWNLAKPLSVTEIKQLSAVAVRNP